MLITTTVRIVESPIFRFIVGKNKKPMTIHTALVAAQSSALRTLVSGAMNEAYTKTVIWDDVDEETFALFAEFVYIGDYSFPAYPNKNLDSTTVSSDDDDQAEIREVSQIAQPESASCNHAGFAHVRATRTTSKDCSLPFLVHARLYVLADKYNITKLMFLTNEKLDAQLTKCIPVEVADYDQVMELVRYVYDNTPPSSSTSKRILLRQTVLGFIADQRSDLFTASYECLSVVEECGAFARDLVSYLLEQRRSFPKVKHQFSGIYL